MVVYLQIFFFFQIKSIKPEIQLHLQKQNKTVKPDFLSLAETFSCPPFIDLTFTLFGFASLEFMH